MGATIEALQARQEIELQIIDIQQQMKRKEKAIAFQQKALAGLQRTAKEQHDRLMTVQKDTDALDLDLKARAAHVAKLRAQLNSAKTNKEYAAVLQELNTQKADETTVEGGVMEKLQEIEVEQAEAAETQANIEVVQTRLEEAQRQYDRTKESLSERLTSLCKKREGAVAALDPAVARDFDRTSERYEGEALARIVRTNPRRDEFICDGCNMTINPERYNAVVTRDEVQTCSSCGRILYVDVDG